jgi:hypothetical protein
MSESEEFKSDYPSTETIDRLRKAAIFYFICGLILVVCSKLSVGRLVLAIGAGSIICAVGIGWLMANNPVNKKTGSAMIVVGVLVMLSGINISILPTVTGLCLSVISMGLLVLGIKYLVAYFIAQKNSR